jgi:hypothetical protein
VFNGEEIIDIAKYFTSFLMERTCKMKEKAKLTRKIEIQE